MAWDAVELEIAVLFQHLAGHISWDAHCEKFVARRREVHRRGNQKWLDRARPKAGLCHDCSFPKEPECKMGRYCNACHSKRYAKPEPKPVVSRFPRFSEEHMKRKELRQQIIGGLARRRCSHGARRMTMNPTETPVACVECILDVLVDPLAEESESVQIAEPVVSPTSWYTWKLTHVDCYCGAGMRIHPDGDRMVCAYGHTKDL